MRRMVKPWREFSCSFSFNIIFLTSLLSFLAVFLWSCFQKKKTPGLLCSAFSDQRESTEMPSSCNTTSQQGSTSQNTLITLPIEIINHILSYLTHPRSRLPGLSEAQSSRDFPAQTRTHIKNQEDLTSPPDTHRWAADLFTNNTLQHPFHTLSLTSKRCNTLVESYCAHKVRSNNTFNLPFAHLDKNGPFAVWPHLNSIVYRRLWLQHAPRKCIYCFAVLDTYPFPLLKRLLAGCQDCFYRQTLVTTPHFYYYYLYKKKFPPIS
ncbi:hypothetical protein GQ44DRAFT_703603 [Phaeosphaeriaceae sp. PMI808]|nr:hypothetical protein GQ44DRAFT_703603 [Phaeosphaeriaceae sp. PMI808]